MTPVAAVRRIGAVLGLALMASVAAEPPSDPRIAHARWLADSGHLYRAAAELLHLRDASLPPAAEEARAALRDSVFAQLATVMAASDAVPTDAAASAHRGAVAEAPGQGDDPDDAVLEQWLGATRGNGAVARGQRDQAHLLLGRRALDQGAGEAAREHFRAVHSPGPYATEALLALGWSYLLPIDRGAVSDGGTSIWAPATVPLRAESADALAALRRSTPFRRAPGVVRNERAGDLEAALGVWQELIGRDPLDPAVQEGLLAIAYAYQHLGAQDQALRRYEHTLDLLVEGRRLLDEARRHIDSGALLQALRDSALGPPGGWPWWAVERRAGQWWRDLDREVPSLYYARYLMTDAGFRDTARRVQLLAVALDRMQTLSRTRSERVARRAREAAAGLRARLDEQSRALQERAAALVTSRRTLTERAMAEAHFALARMREPGVAGPAATALRTGEVAP